MNQNPYQKLTDQIPVPEALEKRVLEAAREASVPARPHLPVRRWVRVAVCAACALALVLGTWRVYPGADHTVQEDGAPVAALPSFSFGLTAYAADTGAYTAPNANGALAFRTDGEGSWSESGGYYTGCMFQITGENIASVALSIDRGGLYRYRMHTDLTEAEMAQCRKAMEEGTLTPAAISQAEDGTWYTSEITLLGADAAEDYDPEVSYGFWVQGTDAAAWKANMRAASQESIDQLDGACLTVEIIFTDGSSQTKTYSLTTGRLGIVGDGDSPGGTLLPQLAGDDEPYVYGVYAESQTEGRYFQWPVQGAHTVRTSNSYGGRWQPGGQSLVFHYGIDIPADTGTPVLAAADGTVKEIGFDAERGNYILLDHGGGLETLYGQCRNILSGLEEGDAVSAGEMIAAVGSTGMSTGPHLHLEVLQDGEPQNPVLYFDSATRDTLRVA